jgi:hypothetical protein
MIKLILYKLLILLFFVITISSSSVNDEFIQLNIDDLILEGEYDCPNEIYCNIMFKRKAIQCNPMIPSMCGICIQGYHGSPIQSSMPCQKNIPLPMQQPSQPHLVAKMQNYPHDHNINKKISSKKQLSLHDPDLMGLKNDMKQLNFPLFSGNFNAKTAKVNNSLDKTDTFIVFVIFLLIFIILLMFILLVLLCMGYFSKEKENKSNEIHKQPIGNSSLDRKLATSAQMYQYQYQKQQILNEQKAKFDDKYKGDFDDKSSIQSYESDGQGVVYESSGPAAVNETNFEITNPLFQSNGSVKPTKFPPQSPPPPLLSSILTQPPPPPYENKD